MDKPGAYDTITALLQDVEEWHDEFEFTELLELKKTISELLESINQNSNG